MTAAISHEVESSVVAVQLTRVRAVSRSMMSGICVSSALKLKSISP
jgi:hypothetical protein